MVSFPNIKINLGLNIVEKRKDNFHNIESIFYPVPFHDILEILPAEKTSFEATGITIPGDASQNLCLKAYHLLRHDFEMPEVKIILHKVVPIGAGLGGGSSDGAFTLKILNKQFGLGLSIGQLQGYAQKLGSDCAFFIENTAKYCFHKGDEFEAISLDLSSYHFAIIFPNIHISTPEAYAGVRPQKPKENLRDLISQPIATWKDHIVNDFETSIFPKYPLVKELKEFLYSKGAVYASMSGSGSSLFGIFDQTVDLSEIEHKYLVWKS